MTDDIVAQLRLWSENAKEQNATDVVLGLCQAADEIERLRHERDEARREVCELRTDIGFSRPMASRVAEFAASRGWDCFQ